MSVLKKLEFPLIQGGMGVGVSLSNLAGNVMRQGCLGVISAAHPGYRSPQFHVNSVAANCRALQSEINKARIIAQGKGLLGVNIMYAGQYYDHYVTTCIQAKVDVIISGAGIPLDLPKYDPKHQVLLAPIVSSGRVAELICKVWQKRYQRLPDFIVIEGSLAGGHLGFSKEALLTEQCPDLCEILDDVKQHIQDFEINNHQKIPLFVAGGIIDGTDIAYFLKAGADGVQMGTRFIATYECDASDAFKQAVLQCQKEDIKIVHSPSGFPGRAIYNEFFKRRKESNRICLKRCFQCLKTCTPLDTPYCISQALIQSVSGNIDRGVIFVGARAGEVNEYLSVKQLIEQLRNQTKMVLEKAK